MNLLGLLFTWALCGGRRSSTSTPVPSAPVSPRPAPSAQPPLVTTSTAPWPQQVPAGLPPYPGPGWITDLPPTPGVPQRAAQLLPTLWARGEGAYRIEQTGGRWIAYRATLLGAKRGVTAKRLRDTPSAAPSASTSVAPASTSAPRVLKVRLPGGVTVPITEVVDNEGKRVPNVAPAQPAPQAAAPAPLPPAPASPVSLPTLRLGSRGPDVVTLQSHLGGLTTDGIFGRQTLAAVRAFQGSKGLVQDGIVGPKTWAALYG